jgi:hypothetical protein
MPDPATGELKIDPDILLVAKKFNLAIDFFYSSHNFDNAEYGQSRSASDCRIFAACAVYWYP